MRPAPIPGCRLDKNVEAWNNSVGDKLSNAVDVYNSATSTLDSRVLVSARRLRELKAAPEGVEIDAIEPVERTARSLQAVELPPRAPQPRRGCHLEAGIAVPQREARALAPARRAPRGFTRYGLRGWCAPPGAASRSRSRSHAEKSRAASLPSARASIVTYFSPSVAVSSAPLSARKVR